MSKRNELPTLPPQAKRHMGIKASNAISNALIYALLVVITIVWLVPFACIVLQSFRCESTHMVGYVIPKQWGFDNYVRLFTSTSFPKWYLNTFLIALFTAAGQTIITLCMSYTLSRFRFKLRKPLMQFMLILGMFPGMLGMIILYNVLKDLGMTGAHAVPGLILVNVASSGMGYYVSKGFFDTIPMMRGIPIGMARMPVKSLLASNAPPKLRMPMAPRIMMTPTRRVARRATFICCFASALGLNILRYTSLVSTPAMMLYSELSEDIVAANIDENIIPITPTGRSMHETVTYDISGSAISGIICGDTTAGRRKTGVNTKNRIPLTTPTLLAAFSSFTQ